MHYAAERVVPKQRRANQPDRGIRLRLLDGDIEDLYARAIDRLDEFYHAATPVRHLEAPPLEYFIDELVNGERERIFAGVFLQEGERVTDSLGNIVITHFKYTPKPRTPRRRVDHTADYPTAGSWGYEDAGEAPNTKEPYECITLFFETEKPSGYQGDNWERQTAERDAFLRLVSQDPLCRRV